MNRADRIRGIVELYNHMLDFYPSSAFGTVSTIKQERGVVGTKKVECPHCDGSGKTKRGKTTLVCKRCNGAGHWKIDAYTSEEVATTGTLHPRGMTIAELDSAIAGLSGDRGDTLLDALDRNIRSRTSKPYYEQLAEATMALGDVDPFAHGLIAACLVLEWWRPVDLPHMAQVRLCRGLVFVEQRLPQDWRPPKWALEWRETRAAVNQTAARKFQPKHIRNDQIRARYAELKSERKVALEFGMSKTQVRRIIAMDERKAA